MYDCGRVLDIFKVSEHLSLLLCAFCRKEVARWEDAINPGRQDFSEAVKLQMR